MSEILSYRCGTCNVNWAPRKQNRRCPSCGEKTLANPYDDPIDDEDALLGGPIAVGAGNARQAQEDALVAHFAAWLDTVGPDDFAATIDYSHLKQPDGDQPR